MQVLPRLWLNGQAFYYHSFMWGHRSMLIPFHVNLKNTYDHGPCHLLWEVVQSIWVWCRTKGTFPKRRKTLLIWLLLGGWRDFFLSARPPHPNHTRLMSTDDSGGSMPSWRQWQSIKGHAGGSKVSDLHFTIWLVLWLSLNFPTSFCWSGWTRSPAAQRHCSCCGCPSSSQPRCEEG